MSIKDHVMEKIQQGRVAMRPRWHFVLQAILAAVGGIIIALTLVFLISFIIFVVRATGVWFAPGFGLFGIRIFFSSLPWILIVSSLIFLIVLELLVRRYSFTYQKPLAVSLVMILGFVCITGIVVARTPLHRGVFRFVEAHHVPFAEPLYHGFGAKRFAHIHPGSIRGITEEGFVIELPDGEKILVVIESSTRFPSGNNFQEGDRVVVFGERENSFIHAFGIKPIREDMLHDMPLFQRRSRMVPGGKPPAFQP